MAGLYPGVRLGFGRYREARFTLSLASMVGVICGGDWPRVPLTLLSIPPSPAGRSVRREGSSHCESLPPDLHSPQAARAESVSGGGGGGGVEEGGGGYSLYGGRF